MSYGTARASMVFGGKSVISNAKANSNIYSYRIHRKDSPGGQIQAEKNFAKLVILVSAYIAKENKRNQNLFPLMGTIYQDGFTLKIYDNLGGL